MEGQVENNLEVEEDARYVDDARVWLYPVRPGWRWVGEDLVYEQQWEVDDEGLSGEERTRRVVYQSMQGLTKGLRFTTEICSEFPGGWLPTLSKNCP